MSAATARIALLSLFLTMGFLAGCATIHSPESRMARSFQETVDRLKEVQPHGPGLPAQFWEAEPEPKVEGWEFDVQEYFKVRTHLAMEKGCVLDWVYQRKDTMRQEPWHQWKFNWPYISSGGAPTLYARKDGAPRFFTYSQLVKAVWKEGHLAEVNEAYREVDRQRSEGDSSYRPSKPEIQQHRSAIRKKVLELGVEPTVEIQNQTVRVSVVTFSKWDLMTECSGFQRRTFAINQSFPHKIREEQPVTLVPFECGTVF